MDVIRRIIRILVAGVLSAAVTVFCASAMLTDPAFGLYDGIYESDVLSEVLEIRSVYDACGRRIYTVNGCGRLTSDISEVPEHTLNAFIAVEDARFYEHDGYDVRRMISAAAKDIASMSAREGASTITQQLAKNLWLSSEKTLLRKLTELTLARKLERDLSKREILGLYLDAIYFGHGVYGITSAAHMYFDTDVNALDIGQSAMLAGIINNPSAYDPFAHRDAAEARKRTVLKRMHACGYITEAEKRDAMSRTPLSDAAVCKDIFARYAVDGRDDAYTAYSEEIQNAVTNAVRRFFAELQGTLTSVVVFDACSERIVAAAANTFEDISRVRRQAGSIVKPILCYAPALETGLITPVTPLLDKPLKKGYSPRNYGGIYYGWVTATESLCRSLNIPAVKLMDMVGVDTAKEYAWRFGLGLTERDGGLSLALGSSLRGERLTDLARAYCKFARCDGSAVSKDTAYLINSMLSRCAEEGTAKALSGIQDVAAKTGTVGTADGNTDAYCIAYDPKYVVAAWVGADDGGLPEGVTGGGLPAEICAEILKSPALDGGAFRRPDTVVSIEIDASELRSHHRVVRADCDTPLCERMRAEFSVYNLPGKRVCRDLSACDGDNFRVVDRFVDERVIIGYPAFA